MTGPFTTVAGCDLCKALKLTPWYHEDDICWIAECDVCETPMVVWRWHGAMPPLEHKAYMHRKLREITLAKFGEFYIDDHMRNIPDHYHAHGRPAGGFWGYEFDRP